VRAGLTTPDVLLVLDFDGTITTRDTLDFIVEQHAPAVFREAEDALQAGTMTLNEVIAYEFGHVTSTLAEVLDLVRERIVLRPGLPELVDFCRERFVDAVVLSSGFHEVIEPVLAWNGVSLPVIAHSVSFGRDGAEVTFIDRPACPVCGEPCKRGDLPRLAAGRRIAYAGDGWSDRCGAAAADLVFARSSLADHLAATGVAYEPFDDLRDVQAGLARYLLPA
jgi:2-hydroxy-3-keto-5-methylthiopentenyl-1-phosphate phosphatase